MKWEKLIKMYYKAATSSRKTRNLLALVETIIFFAYVLLFIVVSHWVDKFLGFPRLLPSPLNVIVFLPLLAIGLFLSLWPILHFFKAKGTPLPSNPPPRLVSTGPYAYVRHPMLTGIFILLFGLGVLLKSISLVFIFTPLFILFEVLWLKMVEEPELERRLGKEYIEYKKRTPMFIPRLRVNTKK